MSKARRYFGIQTLRTIYFSIFQSHLAYCIESWGFTFKTYIEPVVILQKRALRLIHSVAPGTPSRALFIDSSIMPLINLRDYRTALQVFQIINNQSYFPSDMFTSAQHHSRSASQGKFLIPSSHNNYGQRRLKYTGVKIWNDFPLDIIQSSRNTNVLKNYFMLEKL